MRLPGTIEDSGDRPQDARQHAQEALSAVPLRPVEPQYATAAGQFERPATPATADSEIRQVSPSACAMLETRLIEGMLLGRPAGLYLFLPTMLH